MPVTDTEREWITAREAAELLAVHPKTVQRACRRGVIRAELSGGTWLIARVGLAALRALRPESEKVADVGVGKAAIKAIDRTKGRRRKRRSRSSSRTATVE